MDARDAKRIVLANQLTLSYLFISSPYYFVFRGIGTDALAWILLPILSLHGLTLWLNSKGYFLAARLNLALLTSISITVFAFALGRGSGLHLLLLPATMNFLILFDWEKERTYLTAGLAVNAILFLCYQSLSFHAGKWYSLPNEVERWVRIAVTIAAELGIIVGTLHFLVANQRTERALTKDSESAMAAGKIKSRFIANMSHEIRTPLNIIMGMVNLLDKPLQEAERKDLLNNIRGSATDLLAILNDVLDLSRIEAGKMKLESIPFRMREVADAVLQPFLHEARQKNVLLSLEMEAGMPDSLCGDPLRLRQILNNLLSNALKFTRSGKVSLRIRQAGGGESPLIDFEVQDTGVGIPEHAQAHFFNPFRQGDYSITRKFGGSGLGLAICEHLAEMMDGTIGLTSRPGEGTTVRVTIPFALAANAEESGIQTDGTDPQTEPVPTPAAKNAANVRILIVDDHPMNRLVLTGMLQDLGFKAEEAFDGKQALESYSYRPFDLLLMDCHMPIMDGFECTRRIRQRGGTQPLIIGVTADAMIETRTKCLQAGMNEVILKPLEVKVLRRILAPWKKQDSASLPVGRQIPAGSEWVDAPRLEKLVEATRLRHPKYRRKALDQFHMDARVLSHTLREACQSRNTKELLDSAHGLKGLCLTMGLFRLAEACKHLEVTATDGTVSDWSPALAEVEAALEPSLSELRRLAHASQKTQTDGEVPGDRV